MIIYKFLKHLYLNIKYTKIVKSIYSSEDLLSKFSQLFGSEFRVDWVGRIYTVINPNIINGELDVNTQIFEYGEDGLSNNVYVERWIMTRLNLVKDFIVANNLFDILTYEIKKIDEYDNYLFIIKPITFDDCIKYTKKFAILFSVLLVIVVTILVLL